MRAKNIDGHIKVLHVLNELRPSGMERMLVSAAPYFFELGVQGSIRGLSDGSTFAEDLRAAGYEVVVGDPVAETWKAAVEFRSWVRNSEFDIIHIHSEGNYLRTALVARWALGLRRGRIIRTVHNVFSRTGLGRLKRLLQAVIADPLMAAIVAPSPDVADNERSYLRSCMVIFNWVADEIFEIRAERKNRCPRGPRRRTALIVGNCSQVKRHELAIEAVELSDLSLMHLGDEASAGVAELETLNSLEKQGRLRLRGVMTPKSALGLADVFLMPSRHEGMSVALAEALVAGLPVVISDVPGQQWARAFPAVLFSDDTVHGWREAIAQAIAISEQAAKDLPVDLSAARGAHEYAHLYLRALE